MNNTIISLPEYQTIVQIMHAVLDTRAEVGTSCLFFSYVGAMLLRLHHRVKAVPRAGAAAYALDSATRTVAAYGRFENDEFVSSPEAFHAWIEADGVVIDFMAPLFAETFALRGSSIAVPRRMFQKPLKRMAPSVHELYKVGDFFVRPNPDLSEAVFEAFPRHLSSMDLAKVCAAWYRRPPKKTPQTLKMHDDLGTTFELALGGIRLDGVW